MNLPPELTGLMWAIALGVIPAAAVVSTLCTVCVKRPATRHALWLVVLLLFITPLTALLPGAPRLPDPIEALAAAKSSRQSAKPATTPTPTAREPAAPLHQAAQVAKSPQDEPRAPRLVTSAPATTTLSIAPAPERIGVPRSTQPRRSAPIDSTAALGAFTVPGSAPAHSSVYSVTPSRQAPVRSYGLSSLRSAAPSKFEAKRDPAPAPAESVAIPVIERAPASAEPAVAEPAPLQAAPSEVDRYLDRLIGVRDAVAAVPPPPGELWLSGVLVILCVALLRRAWRRRACHDVSPADAQTRLLIAACAQRIGLRRPPEAFMTARRVSPLVTCGARPRIILPGELWNSLDDRARQAVIFHELAHLRRGDHWIRWIEQGVTLAYWWHPIIWWVRSRLRQEADLCCDAWVTSLLPSARRAYAEALISTRAFLSERTDPAPAAGLAMTSARAKRFARRLTMVMTHSARPRTSPLGIALALAVAAAGTIVVPTLACPNNEKAHAAKAPQPTLLTIPAPTPPPEPVISIGVLSAPTPPAPPSAPRAPKPPKARLTKAPPTPIASDESSFEQYMRAGPDAEALRQLEERLSRLEKGIEALHTQGRLVRIAPAPRIAGAPSTPSWAPGASAGVGLSSSDDDRIKRLYVIPQGKLEDLTELMARSDVPVLINKGCEAITVYGNSEQHQAFYNFLMLINPDGVKVISEDEDSDSDAHDHNAPAATGRSSMKQGSDAQRELARRMSDEIRAAVDARRAEMDQVRSRMRDMQGKRRDIEREARAIERKADQMREQAERVREQAERIREQRSQSENADSPELAGAIAQLESQAAEIDAQAEALEGQYAAREQEVESMEAAADDLESRLDEMAEQIEAMVESATDSDDNSDPGQEV